MDIMFREVDLISVTAQNEPPFKVNVHLDNIDSDDIFNSIADEVTKEKITEHFMLEDLVTLWTSKTRKKF